MGMQKIKDFGEWLLNYIPPKPKVARRLASSVASGTQIVGQSEMAYGRGLLRAGELVLCVASALSE